MLNLHFLNVGHGSSTVIEYYKDGSRYFGVVDSNARAKSTPRALEKLRELKAESLSFVCLTHPHRDHFSGLYSVICAFKGKIGAFYSCPMGGLHDNRKRLKKFAQQLRNLEARTDNETQSYATEEFLQIIRWADGLAGNDAWHECSGDYLRIAPRDFAGVEIATILPPNKSKGGYIDAIEKGQPTFGTAFDNQISLALQFMYSGVRLVLGGDGTKANWENRKRYEQNISENIEARIVNLPHHGSKYDCDDSVLHQLYAPTGLRAAITSADGMSHPDIEIINWLQKHEVLPFCTNLIPQCGANAKRLLTLPDVRPELARWLREVAANQGAVQPCQGDVLVQVRPDGTFQITSQTGVACPYRGEYDTLFGM